MTFATSTSNISIAAAFKAVSGGTSPPAGVRVTYVQHDNGPKPLRCADANYPAV